VPKTSSDAGDLGLPFGARQICGNLEATAWGLAGYQHSLRPGRGVCR
jgi:hypothetical protein